MIKVLIAEDQVLIQKDIWNTVVWSEGNYAFLVDYTGSSDETIEIAESVILIAN